MLEEELEDGKKGGSKNKGKNEAELEKPDLRVGTGKKPKIVRKT